MANSAFKWRISKNGQTYNAYLFKGMADDELFPIIYDEINQRYTSNGTTFLDGTVSEMDISTRVSLIGSEEEYTQHFNDLKTLCNDFGVTLQGTAHDYYDLSVSACGDMSDGYKCPMLQVVVDETYTGRKPGVKIVESGITNGEYYYKLEFQIPYIPGPAGVDGEQGAQGNKGARGAEGENGREGRAGKGRNIMCFIASGSSEVAPTIDQSTGKYFPNTGVIEYPRTSDGKEWGNNNEGSPGEYIWMTNADFDNAPNTNPNSEAIRMREPSPWADPICVTGEKGDNGADGDSIEFIYKLSANKPEIPDNDKTVSDYVPQGWTDHPSGIEASPADKRKEWMCQRKKNAGESLWGDWNGPVMWACYGEDGIDGDGIEYLFAVTNSPNDDARQSINNKLPKSTDLELSDHWQDPEIWDYIRNNHLEDTYIPWTDDPTDVSRDNPYEWVSLRKRKWVESEGDSKFGEFSTPQIWAMWSEETIVFDLSEEMESITTGSDYKLDLTTETSITFETQVYVYGGSKKIDITNISSAVTNGGGATQENLSKLHTIIDSSDTKNVKFYVTIDDGFDFSEFTNQRLNFELTGATQTTTRVLYYTIMAIRDGKDGEEGKIFRIITSVGSIIYNPNSQTYTPSTITAHCELGGDPTAIIYNMKYFLNDTSGQGESYSPNDPLTILSGTDRIIFKAYDSNNNELDSVEIPVLKDGSDGSGIIAELSNDMDGLSVGEDGILDVNTTSTTVASIYSGSTLLKINSVTVTGPSSQLITVTTGETGSDNKEALIEICLSSGINFNDTSITSDKKLQFILTLRNTLENIEKKIRFSILGIFSGKDGMIYKIQTPYAVITKRTNSQTIEPSSISATTLYGMETATGIFMTYVIDNNTEIEYGAGDPITLTYNDINSGITFFAKSGSTGGTVLDEEYISVVYDGAQGAQGDSGLNGLYVEDVYFVTPYYDAYNDITYDIITSADTQSDIQTPGYLPIYRVSSGNSVLEEGRCSQFAPAVSTVYKYRLISQRAYDGESFGAFTSPLVDASFSAGITPEEISAITADVEHALGGQISEALNEIEGLSGQVSSLTMDVNGIDASLVTLGAQLDTTKATVNSQGAQIRTLNASVGNINSSMIEMSSKYVNSIVTSADWKKDTNGRFVDKVWTAENSNDHYIYYSPGYLMVMPPASEMEDYLQFNSMSEFDTYMAGYIYAGQGTYKVAIKDNSWAFDRTHYYYYVIKNNDGSASSVKSYYLGMEGQNRPYAYFYGCSGLTGNKYAYKDETGTIGTISNPLGAELYFEDYSQLTTASTLSVNERYTIDTLIMEAAVPLVDEISQIYQTSSSITQWVSSEDTVAQIAMGINNGSSTILIAADHIELSGDTVAESLTTKVICSENWRTTTGQQGFCLDGAQGKLVVRGDGEFSGTITASEITGGTVSGASIYGGSLNINNKAVIDSDGKLTAYDATLNGDVIVNNENSLLLKDESGVTLWEISSDSVGTVVISNSMTNTNNVGATFSLTSSQERIVWGYSGDLYYNKLSDNSWQNIRIDNFSSNRNTLTIQLDAVAEAGQGESPSFVVGDLFVKFLVRRRNGQNFEDKELFSVNIDTYGQVWQGTFSTNILVNPNVGWLQFTDQNSIRADIYVNLRIECFITKGSAMSVNATVCWENNPNITFVSSDGFPTIGNRLGNDGLYLDFNDSANSSDTHFICKKTDDNNMVMEMMIGRVGFRINMKNGVSGVQMSLDNSLNWKTIGTTTISGQTVLKLL